MLPEHLRQLRKVEALEAISRALIAQDRLGNGIRFLIATHNWNVAIKKGIVVQ